MLEAILIILAIAICGAALLASFYGADKPVPSVKVASWKGYTVTTSAWFWTRFKNFGVWLKGFAK
jgi:hypothetical protein